LRELGKRMIEKHEQSPNEWLPVSARRQL